MSEILNITPRDNQERAFPRIAEKIREGGIIAYPTDTFYGLGCDPFNETAVRRLFTIKGREPGKPILLIISDPSTVLWLAVDRPDCFQRLSHQFWPGPLTFVLWASDRLSTAVTADTGTIGIRLPAHELCRRIVEAAGGVLTGTSANLAGYSSVTTAGEVADQLGDRIDLIVDGGPTAGGAPSTVLDVTRDPPRLVRPGAVPWEAIRGFLH